MCHCSFRAISTRIATAGRSSASRGGSGTVGTDICGSSRLRLRATGQPMLSSPSWVAPSWDPRSRSTRLVGPGCLLANTLALCPGPDRRRPARTQCRSCGRENRPSRHACAFAGPPRPCAYRRLPPHALDGTVGTCFSALCWWSPGVRAGRRLPARSCGMPLHSQQSLRIEGGQPPVSSRVPVMPGPLEPGPAPGAS